MTRAGRRPIAPEGTEVLVGVRHHPGTRGDRRRAGAMAGCPQRCHLGAFSSGKAAAATP
jgi:hypothetical protein